MGFSVSSSAEASTTGSSSLVAVSALKLHIKASNISTPNRRAPLVFRSLPEQGKEREREGVREREIQPNRHNKTKGYGRHRGRLVAHNDKTSEASGGHRATRNRWPRQCGLETAVTREKQSRGHTAGQTDGQGATAKRTDRTHHTRAVFARTELIHVFAVCRSCMSRLSLVLFAFSPPHQTL